MGLLRFRDSMAGHGWTVGPWFLHRVRPKPAPPADPWSAFVEDSKQGRIRLTGLLRRRSSSLLVVVHGLGGDVRAPYALAAARAAERSGFSCLRLHLRGADRLGEDFYHAGLTDDLHAAISSPELSGYERVYLLGYSLGGHVALRYGLDRPSSKLEAIAAISAPLDLDVSAEAFDRPGCSVYRRNVLAGLCEIYENVARRRNVSVPVSEARRVRKIRRWDDLIVAPRYGFRDARHYYESVSVAPRIGELQIRSLLVYAAYDPMVPWHAVRAAAGRVGRASTVRFIERGGHMGFPSTLDLGYGPVLGLEHQLMHWFQSENSRQAR